jgi:hypothetical protein
MALERNNSPALPWLARPERLRVLRYGRPIDGSIKRLTVAIGSAWWVDVTLVVIKGKEKVHGMARFCAN